MQKGQIKKVGNCWLLRYYEPVVEDGRTVKCQKTVKLNIDSLSKKSKPAWPKSGASSSSDRNCNRTQSLSPG